ncbi:MAG: ATP-dependent DNA helicase RecG [Armatimonadota bacterium]
MPNPTHEPWRLPLKPLQLEREQGCADRALIGGMASFVQRWVQQAMAAVSERDLRDALAQVAADAANYGDLGLASRKAFLAEVQRVAGLVEKAATTRPAKIAERTVLRWQSPLSDLPGIGPARTETLSKAGLVTVRDLLEGYPFRYEDRREPQAVRSLEHRQSACLILTITAPGRLVYKNHQKLAIVPATDGSTPIDLTWFNQPYRATQMQVGTRLVVTGQVRIHKGNFALAVSEAEVVRKSDGGAGILPADPKADRQDACPTEHACRRTGDDLHVRRIVPVYSAPPFSQVVMRKLVQAALDGCTEYPEARVPAELVAKRKLMSLAEACAEIHFPSNNETLRGARARLAYDELFFLQIRLAQRRRQAKATHDQAELDPAGAMEELRAALPFKLTGAQERVMAEVLEDLRQPEAANRLIHGDVGAGKTVIAAVALLAAARAGKQGALMAPTEMLAQQHYRTLTELLAPLGVQPVLLMGSMRAADKRAIQRDLMTGEIPLAVGTHALFQESVTFRDLAVAVIDEQHRFGVRQRALLVGKGRRPNCFIMSATPIPRTLALTAFGDFDISILDELPPGRKPVWTGLLTRRQEHKAYQLVSDVVERGQQAYLVCPIIEQNENSYLLATETVFNKLKDEIFPSLKLGLVHGKQDSETREQVMEQFRAGELEAIVATTVIEVGVDVPNATAIIIMNADAFGLAQLHQLRGRVARSHHQAYCYLLTGASNPETIERLQVLERTNDGFLVAEEDLRRRGPGEMAGVRQAGLPDLRMADLLADTPTLAKAREDAFALVDEDPELEAPEQQALKEWLGPESQFEEWTL